MSSQERLRDSDTPVPVSRAAAPLIGAVRLYQRARADAPSPCRFVPSCSTYAVEALEAHGPARGTWLAARRLCRCHPWGGEGFDPVPERSSAAPPTHDREVC